MSSSSIPVSTYLDADLTTQRESRERACVDTILVNVADIHLHVTSTIMWHDHGVSRRGRLNLDAAMVFSGDKLVSP